MHRIDTAPRHVDIQLDQAQATIRRNAVTVLGLLLLLIISLVAAGLATWSVEDPSLSHITSARIRNIVGYPGAVVSDILMQFFGVAAAITIVPPAIWGLRLLFGRNIGRWRRRLALWLLGCALAAGALAVLPIIGHWPLYTGLGGIVGDLVAALPLLVLAAVAPLPTALVAIILAPIAVACLTYACTGTGARAVHWAPAATAPQAVDKDEDEDARDANEDDDDDIILAAPQESIDHELTDDYVSRWSIAAGVVAHWGYSLRGRLRRLGRRSRQPTGAYAPHDLQRFTRRLARIDAQPDALVDHQGHEMNHSDDSILPSYIDANAYPAESGTDAESGAGAPVHPSTSQLASTSASVHGPARSVRKSAASKPAKAFKLPPMTVLSQPPATDVQEGMTDEGLEENARALEGVLQDFGVKGEIIAANPGPVVTLYELEPAPGIKSSRVIGLADDIARSMCAISARVAVVPGRNVIGIELPNAQRETVYLRDILGARDFKRAKARLPLCLGKTIAGDSIVSDLARMPHLLIAGTTGSGKSVAINTMILSLLYRLPPQQCRLIMIDPKMLELSVYDGIPHLLTPVVTDPKKAVVALKWTVREMEERYKNMSRLGVRNIEGFNARVREAHKKGENLIRTVQTGFDPQTGEAIYEQQELSFEPMPFIVVIVDEMADLMMVAGKDIEGTIQRLAQMARAAGIHLIMATQRPSVDVITGTIKANFPTRISFQVTSKIDSRTILGEMGAEQLLGMGDMLYMMGGGRISRLHGPFVSDEDVEKVVAHLKTQGTPEYLEAVTDEDEVDAGGADDGGGGAGDGDFGSSGDELYDKAVSIVLSDRKASTSYIQRRLSIGYNRAATLIERMEQEELISPANHAGKREILIPESEEQRL